MPNSITRHIPNSVTCLNLFSGCVACVMAFEARYEWAFFFIILSAVFDFFDGMLARLLHAYSNIGKDLDSLADDVSFGVAPAILLYQWTLFDLPKFGWFFCLLMAIGMAMRLARFNTMLDDEPQPEYWNHFFVGVPAPAAAALVIMPIMISFDFPEVNWIFRSNTFCAILLVVVTLLMVSRIPTFSTKKLKVPTYMFMPLMLVVALFASFIISQPWLTLGLATICYAFSIPIGIIVFWHEKKKYS